MHADNVAHIPGKVGIGGLNQEMVAGGHETEAGYSEFSPLRCLLKKIKECMVIGLVSKDLPGSPATVHHVIPGIRMFYPQWLRHWSHLTRMNTRVKGRFESFITREGKDVSKKDAFRDECFFKESIPA